MITILQAAQQCDGGCLRLSSWPQKYGRISFLPAASVNQCCAAVEGADQLSLMDLMTDGSSNNTPPFPSQMKNTNLLFSNKAEAFRWNHHYDRKRDQYGDKQKQLTCTQTSKYSFSLYEHITLSGKAL